MAFKLTKLGNLKCTDLYNKFVYMREVHFDMLRHLRGTKVTIVRFEHANTKANLRTQMTSVRNMGGHSIATVLNESFTRQNLQNDYNPKFRFNDQYLHNSRRIGKFSKEENQMAGSRHRFRMALGQKVEKVFDVVTRRHCKNLKMAREETLRFARG